MNQTETKETNNRKINPEELLSELNASSVLLHTLTEKLSKESNQNQEQEQIQLKNQNFEKETNFNDNNNFGYGSSSIQLKPEYLTPSIEVKNLIGEISTVTETSKTLISAITDYITQSVPPDPMMVSALNTYIVSLNQSISLLMDIWKNEKELTHKLILQEQSFQHKKELLRLKYELDEEKRRNNNGEDANCGKSIVYNQEELLKIISQSD